VVAVELLSIQQEEHQVQEAQAVAEQAQETLTQRQAIRILVLEAAEYHKAVDQLAQRTAVTAVLALLLFATQTLLQT
jgi:hypothetical protein